MMHQRYEDVDVEDMDWEDAAPSAGPSAKLKAPDFSPSVAAKPSTVPKPMKNGAKIPKAMLPGKDDLWSAAPEHATSASSKSRKRSRSPPAEPNGTPKQSLAALPQSVAPKLFAPYTFWLSRETSRPIFEFLVRAFGGRIGWPASSGAGSPFEEDDESITHVIIDRPVVERPNETEEERQRRRRRKYVQPQWVVDSINAGKILLEDAYAHRSLTCKVN